MTGQGLPLFQSTNEKETKVCVKTAEELGSSISILSKLHGKILTERVYEAKQDKTDERKGRFRSWRGCVDQILNLGMIVDKK